LKNKNSSLWIRPTRDFNLNVNTFHIHSITRFSIVCFLLEHVQRHPIKEPSFEKNEDFVMRKNEIRQRCRRCSFICNTEFLDVFYLPEHNWTSGRVAIPVIAMGGSGKSGRKLNRVNARKGKAGKH
jgi:hypothetical protein